MWKDEGLVLEPAYNSSTAFDASGTFTPGIVMECKTATEGRDGGPQDRGSECAFHLFFGGVANHSASHTESIGVATASSAWGPFKKYRQNPVFSMWDENTAWCYETSTPARVDEIKATQVGVNGGRFLAVKAVCANSTGLPVLWSPVRPQGKPGVSCD